VGKVHVKQIYEIGKIKKQDEHLAHIDLEQICRSIAGSCTTMGLEIVSDDQVASQSSQKPK
jgi:large subunit ribosomal protein L11